MSSILYVLFLFCKDHRVCKHTAGNVCPNAATRYQLSSLQISFWLVFLLQNASLTSAAKFVYHRRHILIYSSRACIRRDTSFSRAAISGRPSREHALGTTFSDPVAEIEAPIRVMEPPWLSRNLSPSPKEEIFMPCLQAVRFDL